MFPKVKNVNVESLKKRSKLLVFFGGTPPPFLSMNAHEWIHEWFLNVNRAKYTHQTKNRKEKEVTRLASPQPAIHSLHSSYPRSKIIRSFRFYPRSKTECIVAVQGFVHSCSVGFCVEFAVCLCIVCVWFGVQTLHSATH